MEIYSFNINNNPYEVKILSIKKNIARVEVNGERYDIDISDMGDIHFAAPIVPKQAKAETREAPKTEAPVQTSPAVSTAPQKVSAGANDIPAPMPGQISKVLVSEGDAVKAGDVILIMEAMKMENQIKSPVDGTIGKIHVSAGDTVQEGAPLVTMGG
jgi:glutaconyl-CoA decarboxylase